MAVAVVEAPRPVPPVHAAISPSGVSAVADAEPAESGAEAIAGPSGPGASHLRTPGPTRRPTAPGGLEAPGPGAGRTLATIPAGTPARDAIAPVKMIVRGPGPGPPSVVR